MEKILLRQLLFFTGAAAVAIEAGFNFLGKLSAPRTAGEVEGLLSSNRGQSVSAGLGVYGG